VSNTNSKIPYVVFFFVYLAQIKKNTKNHLIFVGAFKQVNFMNGSYKFKTKKRSIFAFSQKFFIKKLLFLFLN
jgi:hypothetical protein